MISTTTTFFVMLLPTWLGQATPTAHVGLFRENPAKPALPLRFSEHPLVPTIAPALLPQTAAIKKAGQIHGAKGTRFVFSARVAFDQDDEIVVVRQGKKSGALDLQVMTLPTSASAKKAKVIAYSTDALLGSLVGEGALVAIGPGTFASDDGTQDRLFCLRRFTDGSEQLDVLGFPLNKGAALPVQSLGIAAFAPDSADYRSVGIVSDDVHGSQADEIFIARHSAELGSRIDIASALEATSSSAFELIGGISLPYPANEPIRSISRLGEDAPDVTSLLVAREDALGTLRLDRVEIRPSGPSFDAQIAPINIGSSAGGSAALAFAIGTLRLVSPPPPPPEQFPFLAGNYSVMLYGAQSSALSAEPLYYGPPITAIGPIPGFSIVQNDNKLDIRFGAKLLASGPLILIATESTWKSYEISSPVAPNFVATTTYAGTSYTIAVQAIRVVVEAVGDWSFLEVLVDGTVTPAGASPLNISNFEFSKL